MPVICIVGDLWDKENRIVMSIDPNQPIKKYLLQLQRKLEVDIRKYTLWLTTEGGKADIEKGPILQDRTWAMYGFEKGSLLFVRETSEDDPKPDPNAPSLDDLKKQMEEKRIADETAKKQAENKNKEEEEAAAKAKEEADIAAKKKVEDARKKEAEARVKNVPEQAPPTPVYQAPPAPPVIDSAPTPTIVDPAPPQHPQAPPPTQPPTPEDDRFYAPPPQSPDPHLLHPHHYRSPANHSPTSWAQNHGLASPPSNAVEALERQVADLQREIRVLKHVNTYSTPHPIEDIPDDDVRAAAAKHLLSLQESILRRRQSANAAVRLYEETYRRGKSTERRLDLL